MIFFTKGHFNLRFYVLMAVALITCVMTTLTSLAHELLYECMTYCMFRCFISHSNILSETQSARDSHLLYRQSLIISNAVK